MADCRAQLAWAIAIGSARPAIHCAEDSPRSHDPRSHDLTAAVHLAREERRYSPPICLGVEAAIIFFEKLFVSLVNGRMCIRIVRLDLFAYDVLMCFGPGEPVWRTMPGRPST